MVIKGVNNIQSVLAAILGVSLYDGNIDYAVHRIIPVHSISCYKVGPLKIPSHYRSCRCSRCIFHTYRSSTWLVGCGYITTRRPTYNMYIMCFRIYTGAIACHQFHCIGACCGIDMRGIHTASCSPIAKQPLSVGMRTAGIGKCYRCKSTYRIRKSIGGMHTSHIDAATACCAVYTAISICYFQPHIVGACIRIDMRRIGSRCISSISKSPLIS